MIEISRAQLEMLLSWFQPEEPGSLIGQHVMHTGIGRAWVDKWPAVNAVVVETNYNYLMVGDPAALDPQALIQNVAGFVAAPPTFLPILEATFPTLVKWPRIIGWLPDAPHDQPAVDAELRRLRPDDANDLEMLSAATVWVSQTWGGGRPLAQSGYGWGAWVNGVLASVACTFFLADDFEDLGVVTEPEYQGRGLSTACCYELCLDIIARGRKPSWTTSPDNKRSWRVAEKLGFVHHRHDWNYVIGREVPKSSP